MHAHNVETAGGSAIVVRPIGVHWMGGEGEGHYVALYQSAFLPFFTPADLMRMAVRQGKHGAHLSALLKAAASGDESRE